VSQEQRNDNTTIEDQIKDALTFVASVTKQTAEASAASLQAQNDTKAAAEKEAATVTTTEEARAELAKTLAQETGIKEEVPTPHPHPPLPSQPVLPPQ
jgi:ABC-type hemin transport system ATPase subunit